MFLLDMVLNTSAWHHEILGLKSYDLGMGCHVQKVSPVTWYQGTTVGHLYLTAFSTGHGKEPKPKSNEAEAGWNLRQKNQFFPSAGEVFTSHQILARFHTYLRPLWFSNLLSLLLSRERVWIGLHWSKLMHIFVWQHAWGVFVRTSRLCRVSGKQSGWLALQDCAQRGSTHLATW